MLKKILSLLILITIYLSISTPIFAADTTPIFCNKSSANPCSDNSLSCLPAFKPQSQGGGPWFDEARNERLYTCQKASPIAKIFGTIEPPPALAGFLQKDSTGASAISDFLSRFITLLFSIAAIVLIFMIIWGAFEWLTSGGDKEKLSAAQKRIINAIIGIILFAVAFAIIRILGAFTGFVLFSGQNFTVTERDNQGNATAVRCDNGKYVYFSKDFSADCQKP